MTERVYNLEDWAVHYGSDDPYTPPEVSGIRLSGMRTGDPKRIVTNYVASVDGRRVTTLSGTVYVLGAIEPKYLEWLQSKGRAYDPENPIKVYR